MGATHPSQSSLDIRLKKECWQQILNLLAGKDFFFKSEYWPAFVELVNWHHILIDVLPALTSNKNAHEFNPEQINRLEQKSLTLRSKALSFFQFQIQISRYFTEKGVRHLFFKGIVLSVWLYDSTTSRQCRDIDVIVHPDDHGKACQRLQELGCVRIIPRPDCSDNDYRRYQSATKDVSYLHEDSGSVIELHWALRPFPEAFAFDFDKAYESRVIMNFGESDLPVFSYELHVRYIAAHGCLSHWGRLRWLMDWKMITEQSEADWSGIINCCATQREAGYLRKAFLLLNRQLGTAIPDEVSLNKTTSMDDYVVENYRRSQAAGRYPRWLKRQLLNLLNQHDLKGMAAYLHYMFNKFLAANTLKAASAKASKKS